MLVRPSGGGDFSSSATPDVRRSPLGYARTGPWARLLLGGGLLGRLLGGGLLRGRLLGGGLLDGLLDRRLLGGGQNRMYVRPGLRTHKRSDTRTFNARRTRGWPRAVVQDYTA